MADEVGVTVPLLMGICTEWVKVFARLGSLVDVHGLVAVDFVTFAKSGMPSLPVGM